MNNLLFIASPIITLLLLGWKGGIGLIILTFFIALVICVYALDMESLARNEFFIVMGGYLNFYIYVMWGVGAIWRLSKFDKFFDFKSFLTDRQKLKN